MPARIKRYSPEILQHAFPPSAIYFLITFLVIALLFLQRGAPRRQMAEKISLPNATTPAFTPLNNFESLSKQYQDELGKFDINIKLQATLLAVSLLLVIRRSDSLQLFGNQLPLQWLHIFVPALMIYLWLSFGFLLDDLIKTRIHAVEIINAIHPGDNHLEKYLLHDSGFIDGWIISFVDPPTTEYGAISGIDHNFWGSTALLLTVVFGTFLAAAHAAILAITAMGSRRYAPPNYKLGMYYFAPVIPLAILILSHIQFAYGGHNKNWLQIYMAVAVMPLLIFFILLSISVDRKADVKSLKCLRRRRWYQLDEIRPSLSSPLRRDRPQAHIALIGDSLSTSFYVSALPTMLLRMWWPWQWKWSLWQGNWFLGGKKNLLRGKSIAERLSISFPVRADNYATPRAKVDQGRRRRLRDNFTNTWHFSQQIAELLSGKIPDCVCLWIGHNNMDWYETRHRPENEKVIVNDFCEYYHRYLSELVSAAAKEDRPTLIIVFGLINFGDFFKARAGCEKRTYRNIKRYRYFLKSSKYFDSMRNENQSKMIEIANQCNDCLRRICEEFTFVHVKYQVRVIYSDAFAKAPINKPGQLHQSDGWHPSLRGHYLLADAAWTTLRKNAEYLGWDLA